MPVVGLQDCSPPCGQQVCAEENTNKTARLPFASAYCKREYTWRCRRNAKVPGVPRRRRGLASQLERQHSPRRRRVAGGDDRARRGSAGAEGAALGICEHSAGRCCGLWAPAGLVSTGPRCFYASSNFCRVRGNTRFSCTPGFTECNDSKSAVGTSHFWAMQVEKISRWRNSKLVRVRNDYTCCTARGIAALQSVGASAALICEAL